MDKLKHPRKLRGEPTLVVNKWKVRTRGNSIYPLRLTFISIDPVIANLNNITRMVLAHIGSKELNTDNRQVNTSKKAEESDTGSGQVSMEGERFEDDRIHSLKLFSISIGPEKTTNNTGTFLGRVGGKGLDANNEQTEASKKLRRSPRVVEGKDRNR
jgi:hypothetical protein